MIVEMRVYQLRVGSTGEFIQLFEERVLPLELAICDNLLGSFVVDVGPLNTHMTLWRYDSLEQRKVRNAQAAADPELQLALKAARSMIEHQESQLLVPTRESPIS